MLSIRSALARDVPLLKTLIHEFAEFYKFPVSITQEQLSRDGFGSQPKFRVLIAQWAGEAAGYALFFDHYSSFHGRAIFLEDLFIRPQFRGKNVGKALLARVAAIAQEDGPFGVIFNVLEWNRPAITFYEKLGATFWDDWKTVCLQGDALKALAESFREKE
jgi:GNAT superfamily N-acetyltransferase